MDSESYVLTCYRYIELNPVRAWMIDDPAAYPWSSHSANALRQFDPLITPHAAYLALGDDLNARIAAYRALFAEVLTEQTLVEIRQYLQQQRALGTDRFRARVEAELKRFAGVRPAHRPRKQASAGVSDTVFGATSIFTTITGGCRMHAFKLSLVAGQRNPQHPAGTIASALCLVNDLDVNAARDRALIELNTLGWESCTILDVALLRADLKVASLSAPMQEAYVDAKQRGSALIVYPPAAAT